VVVIGANNSAHDICAALWEHEADVTMVQRSSTHIVRSDSLMEIGLGALYSEQAVANGVSTRKADLIFASLPYRIMADFQKPLYDQIRERDADFYRALEKAGFMLDFGDDDSGLFMKYLRRASGYYIDVGACDLVIDGSIKLQSGKGISHLSEHAVVLDDGTELPADLVVYATGYGSMNGWVADLISPEVADRVGKVWGLGSATTKDPGPGKASSATCGSPRSSRGCGSTAATCTSHATTRCTWRFSSRPAWRGCRCRSTACRPCTTPAEPAQTSRPVAAKRSVAATSSAAMPGS
jgi:putative flavoprotein involved in K+ transport